MLSLYLAKTDSRFKYEYEIEYEDDFSVLGFRLLRDYYITSVILSHELPFLLT